MVHVKYNTGRGSITEASRELSLIRTAHHQCMMRNHTRHRGRDHHLMQCNLLGVKPAALPYCTLPSRRLTCFPYHVFLAYPTSFLPTNCKPLTEIFWNFPSILLVAKQETTLVCPCFFQFPCSCVGFHLLPRFPHSRPALHMSSTSLPTITPLLRLSRIRHWQLTRISFIVPN